MNSVLVRKLLRDLRVGLLAVGLLLFAFEFLHCKTSEQSVLISRKLLERGIDMRVVFKMVFDQEAGRLIEKLLGGDRITIGQGLDSLTIGYVHPLLLTILSVWAIGRGSGAIAGELDRGTMDLLLAQPLARWRVIASHFAVDCVTIPILCACLWLGTTVGCYVFGLAELTAGDNRPVDPWAFAPAILNVAALLFAVSGYTIAFSSLGRSRSRVLGIAVMVTLVQFLANLLGQTWSAIEFLRPCTVFYYYQPQGLILDFAEFKRSWAWNEDAQSLLQNIAANVVPLLAVGCIGYAISLVAFCRRDLPAAV